MSESEDALKGEDIQSGTAEPNPVNSPTTEEDDGAADDAVTGGATDTNPKTDDPDN